MNATRKAIEDTLHSSAPLLALLGAPVSPFSAAIYAREAPSGAEFPLIIIGKGSGVRRWSFKGFPMEPQVWRVIAVSQGSSSKAEDIDERCEALLNDAALSITSYANLYIRRDADVDYRQDQDGEAHYYVGGEYRLITERMTS